MDKEQQPFSVFWVEFCHEKKMKETVKAICKKKGKVREQYAKKLLEHKFILKEGNGFKMRVPLFEQWVNKNA